VTRVVGWEGRLCAAVETFRARPFAWGEADCLLFVSSCIEAVTGADPAAQERGTYSDALGAVRVLHGLGFSDAINAVSAHFAEISKAQAGRGDLAVITAPSEDDPMGAIGVVLGPIVAGYGATGLHFVSLADILRAFRVE